MQGWPESAKPEGLAYPDAKDKYGDSGFARMTQMFRSLLTSRSLLKLGWNVFVHAAGAVEIALFGEFLVVEDGTGAVGVGAR
jgi:hypothetical protein